MESWRGAYLRGGGAQAGPGQTGRPSTPEADGQREVSPGTCGSRKSGMANANLGGPAALATRRGP
jgi:hypothetical protein